MNRLYLLLPVSDKAKKETYSYIHFKGNINAKWVQNLMSTMTMIDNELLDGYYDLEFFKDIYKVLKKTDENAATYFMQLLQDWYPVNPNSAGMIYVMDGHHVTDKIIQDYLANVGPDNALIDVEALTTNKIIDTAGHKMDFEHLYILPNSGEKVYSWLVLHRSPQRKLDANYKKHTSKPHIGKKGKMVSPSSYKLKDLRTYLHRAVTDGNVKQLYYLVQTDKRIVKFFEENLAEPTYHAFDFPSTDEDELNKMANQRGTLNKMNRVAELYKS